MTLRVLSRAAALALLVISAACGSGSPGGERVGRSSSASVTATGVDYSWARPSPSGLASEGYTFAVRYLSYDTTGKNLSASEATSLWAAGVDVVSNWENSGTAALSGYSQGVSDATAADSQATADGGPAGRPIYFSVDFDAEAGDVAAVTAYFEGVASVIGLPRTGAYGGYYIIQSLFDAGKITWGWQTYAWSGGSWDSRAQLQQVENGITAAGDSGCCDEDQAVAPDFGQWHYQPPVPMLAPPATANGNLAMTLVSWPDEHVELFADTQKGQVVHVYTTGAGDSWSLAASLGASSCAVASVFWPPNSPANVSIFDALPTGKTEDIAYTSGAWPSFTPFGDAGLARLSTLAFSDGRVEVFGLGYDEAIWHHAWDPTSKSWSGWRSLGGRFVTGVAPILWGDGHGEIFATDASGVAWHDWTSSASSPSWGGWQTMTGSKLATRPMPARWADGHVEVFARGVDDTLYVSNSSAGTFPTFSQVNSSTPIAGEPSIVVYASYGPEVFARDPSGVLMHAWTEGSALVAWASDLNETLASDPLAWMRPDGQAEVFGVDPMGNLVKSIHSGPTWSSWSTLATGIDPCTTVPTPPAPKKGSGAGGSAGSGGSGGSRGPGGSDGTGGTTGSTGKSPAVSASSGGCCASPASAPGGAGWLPLALGLAVTTWARRRRG
jgi:uncharacterized membrane protein YgcG